MQARPAALPGGEGAAGDGAGAVAQQLVGSAAAGPALAEEDLSGLFDLGDGGSSFPLPPAATAPAATATAAPAEAAKPGKRRGAAARGKRPADEGDSATGTTVGDDEATLNPEEKRRRRLEKNREIARNCRKRKRQRMEQLEETVKELTEAKRKLELRLKIGYDVEKREDVRRASLREIEKMSRDGRPAEEIEAAILRYKDVFADYGEERRTAIMYHLGQLRKLLLPTQVTKMAMWSLHQDDSFYAPSVSDSLSPSTAASGDAATPTASSASDAAASDEYQGRLGNSGIWNMLSSELKITEEQQRKLMRVRPHVREQRQRLAECVGLLDNLESQVTDSLSALSSQMLELMNCVTPEQTAKFLLWIERNQACMYMLNKLWHAEQSRQARAAAAAAAAGGTSVGAASSTYSGSVMSDGADDERAAVASGSGAGAGASGTSTPRAPAVAATAAPPPAAGSTPAISSAGLAKAMMQAASKPADGASAAATTANGGSARPRRTRRSARVRT